MNSNHQPRQGQPYIAERVAHLETAIDYQSQALAGLRDDMRAGFVRTDAEFVRVHEQLMKIRTTDFRICLLYTSPSPRDRQKSRMPSSA